MKTYFVKSSGLLILLLTLAFIPSCFTQQPSDARYESAPAVVATSSHTLESDILVYINKYRQSKGLSALISNAAISDQATIHSANMATKKVPFSHDGFEERVKNISQKIGTLRVSAENVAYGQLSAEEVVDLWLKSPGHRKNIEGSKFTITGIGVAEAKDGTIFYTQIFASN